MDVDAVAFARHRVLVTGAAGTVGRHVVRELADRGYHVLASDLSFQSRSALGRRRFAASGISANVVLHPADLTDPNAVATLIRQTRPDAVIHLAAVIPPYTYVRPELSHQVNVDSTRYLVHAAENLPTSPHFIQASSMAVYGARNPHHHHGLLDNLTPPSPTELYGAHKLAAEQIVTTSSLNWSILRLAGVLSADISLSGDASLVALEACLPVDGRIHTVAVKDVAVAFERAVALRPFGTTFTIGGDRSHQLFQRDVGKGIASAMGLRDVLPNGRPGNPHSDRDWFITDWLDTTTSQRVLGYQNHSFDDVLLQIRRKTGRKRWLLAVASPIARRHLASSAPYAATPGTYADPWSVIGSRWGWPLLEAEPRNANERAQRAQRHPR